MAVSPYDLLTALGAGRVESADSLAPALEAAFAGGGVHLVTVPVDYSENIRVLVDE
jgi:acetolactate synthase I/II/III large subunit